MNGKKVIITGSSGLLGSSLISKLNIGDIKGYDHLSLNILDSENIHKEFDEEKPDIIIHTAANTNVDDCENNHKQAYLVNVLGTQNLVNYSIGKDILFVYISSTGIYGAHKESCYSEFDNVAPTTIHHKSKYEGEKVVRNHLNKYLIIRTGWLYGGDKGHVKNFVYKRYIEALKNETMYSDKSQIGNPTFVEDLVSQIGCLINSNQNGIFNCVNEAENISRYDYVKKIVDLFELDTSVLPAPEGMYKRIAPVSNNESACNYKLDILNLNVMNSWETSLQAYINQLKQDLK